MWTKMLKPFEPELVLIPAGEFLMGSDPQKDEDADDFDEQPQHRVYLPDYYMAKTPVTNAQYAAFVEAAGYTPPPEWTDRKPRQGEEDHPMVLANWYDALAYCKWLTQVTGRTYWLPSEAEWEKAARGTDGRIYPWGNEWDAQRCNSYESRNRNTTPVRAYPQGASPYGLLDMAGNVWEWTTSLWGHSTGGRSKPELQFGYPYDPKDGRENLEAGDDMLRAVRGGSWRSKRFRVRCASRSADVPVGHDWGVGFRLVVSPTRPLPNPAGGGWRAVE
jgi:formylglycine-generating enzyme required for sulfatase activity